MMVKRPTHEFPLNVFTAYPPSGKDFLEELPHPGLIRAFYCLCDGGFFAFCRWFRMSELKGQTARWMELLNDYDERGAILTPGKHLVFAEDSAGAPIIWDAATDRVASFWFKGGDWEPIAESMGRFLDELFNPKPENGMWFEALMQLREARPS